MGQNMTEGIFFEIHHDLSREGPGRDRYTKQAFEMIPRVTSPRILDVGCGPGGPTMALARLTEGEVVGIDTHQPYLDRLSERVEQAGLTDRVRAVNCSMFEMNFPDESFDIIWAEGSIYIMGFERGLTAWQRFIKPKSFLVVHEMAWLRPEPPQEIRDYWKTFYPGIGMVQEKIDQIHACGYELLGHFTLPDDAWWHEYYGPLEERIKGLRRKYADDPEAMAQLEEEQKEIDIYRKYHEWYGSVFFVMQKK
jgi:SAM-dependent methyltransferase